MSAVHKHFERVAYEHNGIRVTTQIDYHEGTIELCEPDGSQKRWLFAGRTIDYMQGWQNIFDAMKHAVEEARKSLKKHQDAEDKAKAQLMMRVARASKD